MTIRRAIQLLILSAIAGHCYSQSDSSVCAVDIIGSTRVYEDSIGIKSLGSVTGKIFILAPGGPNHYYVYGSGLIGYVWDGNIIFEKYQGCKITYGNIEAKLQRAKRIETALYNLAIANKTKDSLVEVAESIAQLNVLNQRRKKGIVINNFHAIKSTYWGGCSFSITNYLDKTIKYMYLTVTGFNPVNDVISTQRITAVGPIAKDQESSYKFDDIFLTRVLDDVKLVSLIVQFMDGTKRSFTGAALKNIISN